MGPYLGEDARPDGIAESKLSICLNILQPSSEELNGALLGEAPLSAERGNIWREHAGVVRIAFQEECGVACDQGFLILQFNFYNIVADGIGSGIRAVVGPSGQGAGFNFVLFMIFDIFLSAKFSQNFFETLAI